MFNTKLLFFDTETTGLKPDTEDILQLSIIDSDDNLLYNGYFHPVKNATWEEAEKINHISPAMVENAPYFADEREKIQAIFDNAEVICGYNINFDLDFLTHNGIKIKKEIECVDVLYYARRCVPTERHNLVAVAEYLGFNYKILTAHSSLTDAVATKYVFNKIANAIVKLVEGDFNKNISIT